MAKKKEDKQLVFVNNAGYRAVSSKEFNFVLDKESGVSICWGKDENDSPEYDPMTPQQLVLSMNNFELDKFISKFNYLANIKYQISNNEFRELTEEDNVLDITANLTPLSTIASIVLIFENKLTEYNLDDVLKFTKYITDLKLPIIAQFNADYEFTEADLEIIKSISLNIIVKTGETLSATAFNTNILNLKKSVTNISAKMFITKTTFKEVNKTLELIPRDTAIKIYFDKPFITVKQYRDIQQKIIDLQLESIRVATCFDKHFNKKTKNLVIMPMDCDACRFSLYVEDNNVYPCEFYKNLELPIDSNKTLTSIWMDSKIKKFRKTIIQNNFCNKKQKD